MPGITRLALRRMKQASVMNRLLLPAVLLVTACATTVAPPSAQQQADEVPRPAVAAVPVSPEEQALKSLVALQDRLYRVATPLLASNPRLCRNNARNLLGFTAKNKYSYSSHYIQAAQSTLKLNDRLQVMGVLAGGGAARAGLRRGDTLLTVEDLPLPEGENAERQAAALLAPMVTGRSSVKLTVLRDGAPLTLNVPLTHACAFGIELGHTDNVNAYADGYRVLITRGMMNFAKSDEELAFVIAKEMAHNVLGHANQQRMNATIGGVIDNLTRIRPDMSTMVGMAGIRPMPQNLDVMADKLSLYLLASAGYNLDQVVPFWQKMASQYPATMPNAYTALHPATAARISAMEKTLADIRAKKAARKPLVP